MKSAAIAIIFNQSRDEVLLIKRRDVPVWVLPGGGIEPFEEPKEAAIREAYEETGLVVNIIRQTGDYTPLNRLASQTHVFEASILTGKLEKGNETQNIAFFKLTHLPKSFFIIHRYWLDDALKNNFTVKRTLTEVTYLNLLKNFLKHPWLVIRSIVARLGFPIND